MSKSLGNVIDPNAIADIIGTDALRYFLLAEIATGQDSDFSEERLVMSYNKELAGGLERIAASIPPRHLLANDPTIITLAYRLREYATAIRGLSTTVGLDFTRQMQMRDLLLLAEHPVLR
jgi:methionyl-tRNA synthetase